MLEYRDTVQDFQKLKKLLDSTHPETLHAFVYYTLDHIEEYDAIPCEYECPDGEEWEAEKCMEVAILLNLTRFIKT